MGPLLHLLLGSVKSLSLTLLVQLLLLLFPSLVPAMGKVVPVVLAPT